MPRHFNLSRRSFITSVSALMASNLTGCVTTGNRKVDEYVRRTAEKVGSGLISESVFAVLGIPNRLAFVSGRPLTDADLQTASQARELFTSAGVQVMEMPYDAQLFDVGAQPNGAGTLKTTYRRRGAWEGRKTKRGAQQLAAAKGALERYRHKKVLEIPEALDIMAAHRPFFIALAAAEADRKDPTNLPGLVVPAGAHATIPVRTGCLGAGLPLPRAGEGARLISVPGAVHPEQRAAVRGLLKLARKDPDQLKVVQLLIWNLIHADNSGYRKVFGANVSSQQKDLLDKSVPGGWRHYQSLLERAHRRRLDEENKLRVAQLSIEQFNELTGCSFELVPPTNKPVGSAAFAEDILRQGQAAGLDDLRSLANDGIATAIGAGLDKIGLSSVARRAVTESVDSGAITDVLLGPSSPFNPLQGYSLLAPSVGAHLRDIGGTSLRGELAIVNHSAEDFHFEPGTLAAFTPRRTQAQQVEADYASAFVREARGGKDGLTSAEEKLANILVGQLADYIKDKAINGIDEKLLAPGVARLLSRWPVLASRASKVPVLGTLIALHDLNSYLYGDKVSLTGDKMTPADAVITSVALVPALNPVAKQLQPALAPLAEAWYSENTRGGTPDWTEANKAVEALTLGGQGKRLATVLEGVYDYGKAYANGQTDFSRMPEALTDAFQKTAHNARILGLSAVESSLKQVLPLL